MNKRDWAGVYPAMLTPLKEDETLDEETTSRFVNQLLDQGVAGLYLTGNSGEGYALDEDVQASVYPVVAKAAKGRCKLIAHTGGGPTRRAIRLTRAACEAGMDAVSAITPYAGWYSTDELIGYYRDIAAASDRPLFAYHIPLRSGYDLSLADLYRIMEIPNVEGMKYTHEDCFKLERLVSRFPDKLFFMGCDQMLLQGLTAGAMGGIGTTYNMLGPAAVTLFERFQAGDRQGSHVAQSAINGFIECYFSTGGGLGVLKALAAKQYGWEQVVSPSPRIVPDSNSLELLGPALNEALQCASQFLEEGQR